jgi:Winged helix DNA-binding domain
MHTAIAEQRLENHGITGPGRRRPADVVKWMGAVQAQEYLAAKWALALRMCDGATSARIDRALNEGTIIRTHVLRPTWHFVCPSDIHWMLDLTAPRVHQALAYAHRQFETDAATRSRAARIFERALRDGHSLTRAELGAHLARTSISTTGVRLWLLTVYAELEGVICSGAQRGTQMTYALLGERVPRIRRLPRDEALAELTTRYFRSHGPATIRDFVWWSGLTAADAKRGLEMSRARQQVIDDRTYWTIDHARSRSAPDRLAHLLPAFDEYLVAYRDLAAVPREAGTRGRLGQALVVAGRIVGTWQMTRGIRKGVLKVTAQRALTRAERAALDRTIARYQQFLGVPVSVSLSVT